VLRLAESFTKKKLVNKHVDINKKNININTQFYDPPYKVMIFAHSSITIFLLPHSVDYFEPHVSCSLWLAAYQFVGKFLWHWGYN
jgi:hypothetical protein